MRTMTIAAFATMLVSAPALGQGASPAASGTAAGAGQAGGGGKSGAQCCAKGCAGIDTGIALGGGACAIA